MTVVTPEERDAMSRLRNIMEGIHTPEPTMSTSAYSQEVELPGAGQTTRADVSAMSDVLSKLNNISNHVVDNIITESVTQPILSEALQIQKLQNGIKVGRYQILVKEDSQRLAGKQFYSIYNSLTNDTIADDISLYETALAVVRLLNNGKFANSVEVRQLFEQDNAYTSHKVDAINFKRRLKTVRDATKQDIYESRLQASMDRCMAAKKHIKNLANAT
jgi:hypothetical protein